MRAILRIRGLVGGGQDSLVDGVGVARRTRGSARADALRQRGRSFVDAGVGVAGRRGSTLGTSAWGRRDTRGTSALRVVRDFFLVHGNGERSLLAFGAGLYDGSRLHLYLYCNCFILSGLTDVVSGHNCRRILSGHSATLWCSQGGGGEGGGGGGDGG